MVMVTVWKVRRGNETTWPLPLSDEAPRVAATVGPPANARLMSVMLRPFGPVGGCSRVMWLVVTGWISFTWIDWSMAGWKAPSVHAVFGLPSTAFRGWTSGVL